jgi:membrane-associated protease RseP (regulator of RpoE activity)
MTPAPGTEPEPVDDAQLSLKAWLAQNGPMLLIVAGLIGVIGWNMGLEGMWTIAKVALGLGLVIFIHELGHFLVAKWCDVHVQTFSIGFGPALPGCSFKWGETTYKIALFPLGGYVKMVGEGAENDEEDTDPRSFKNKTVGQRMAIISAGVVMNVILGVICFIVAFKSGVHQTAGAIAVVDAGGPAWTKGMHTGQVLERVGDKPNPHFEDLKIAVMLSGEGEAVTFAVRSPDEKEAREVEIIPRKSKNDPNPLIGVGQPYELKLVEARLNRDGRKTPARMGSPAATARALDLKTGDRVLATSDPDQPDEPDRLVDLPPPPPGRAFDDRELGERLRRLAGKPVKLLVRRAGASADEIVMASPEGFQFEDTIVGMTDDDPANTPYDPFRVRSLALDPRDPQGRHLDFFEYLRRMQRLADRTVVVQVRRKSAAVDAAPVSIFVPPEYHRILPGVRMEMGQVTGVREGSSAARAGVEIKDVIKEVTLTDGQETIRFVSYPKSPGEKVLDPVRLPYELRRWAQDRTGLKASLKVQRENPQTHKEDDEAELIDLPWEKSRQYDFELPLSAISPMAIPELGLAYQVKTTVADVAPDAPAAKKGLKKGDVILEIQPQYPTGRPGFLERVRGWLGLGQPGKPLGEPDWAKEPTRLWTRDAAQGDADAQRPEPRWASTFMDLQTLEFPALRLVVKHESGEKETIETELRPDTDWPIVQPRTVRGLTTLRPQDRIAQADGLGSAVAMGISHTTRTIVQIYLSLKSLLTRRVSATEHLQGPIDIAVYAYYTADESWPDFILLLGIISVNLAVVNFLPIPILDGGHMVFLLYEKLRGRPASEAVRLAANWFGLLVLVSLMIFVLYLGFVRHIL